MVYRDSTHRLVIQSGRRRHQNKEGAQGMVEFALVLPLLLLLVFGIIEFGRMLFIYSATHTASREAARYGSAAGVISGTTRYNDCAGIRERAKVLGSLAGIQDGDISIKYDSGPGTAILPDSGCPLPNEINVIGGIHRIIVEINTEFTPIVPLVNIPPAEIRSRSSRTILSNISVKSEIPVVPTPAPGESHVGDLDGSSFYNMGGMWQARVTITVHDAYENLVQGVTVIGTWNEGAVSITECVTDFSGRCTQTSGDIDPSVDFAIFVPTNLDHPYHNYNASANHDLDGDSDGNSIIVTRP